MTDHIVHQRLTEAADHLHDSAITSTALGRGIVLCLSPDTVELLSKWLRSEADDVRMCDGINDRDPDNPGKTRIIYRPQASDALAFADHILEQKEQKKS